jgi:hypothetical protein
MVQGVNRYSFDFVPFIQKMHDFGIYMQAHSYAKKIIIWEISNPSQCKLVLPAASRSAVIVPSFTARG